LDQLLATILTVQFLAAGENCPGGNLLPVWGVKGKSVIFLTPTGYPKIMMPKSFAQAGLAAIAVAVGTTAAAPAWAATLVGTELVLSVDVSSSIDASEFTLQRQSYANAFRDPDVIRLDRGFS
jgi:hypothetical protein